MLDRGVESVAKAGTIAIVGDYPPTARAFPFGLALNENLTLRVGVGNPPPLL